MANSGTVKSKPCTRQHHSVNTDGYTAMLTLDYFLCTVPDMADLWSELQDVLDWIPLGLYLGIKMERLEAIKADFPTLGQRHAQMLKEWQKNVTPTWSAVVQALVKMGMKRLASELAQKHG